MFGVVAEGRARPTGMVDAAAEIEHPGPAGAGGSRTEWTVGLGSIGLPIPAQRRPPIMVAAVAERARPAAETAASRSSGADPAANGSTRGSRPRRIPPVTVTVHRYANAGPDVFWEISTS
jgi:hypothetical protein